MPTNSTEEQVLNQSKKEFKRLYPEQDIPRYDEKEITKDNLHGYINDLIKKHKLLESEVEGCFMRLCNRLKTKKKELEDHGQTINKKQSSRIKWGILLFVFLPLSLPLIDYFLKTGLTVWLLNLNAHLIWIGVIYGVICLIPWAISKYEYQEIQQEIDHICFFAILNDQRVQILIYDGKNFLDDLKCNEQNNYDLWNQICINYQKKKSSITKDFVFYFEQKQQIGRGITGGIYLGKRMNQKNQTMVQCAVKSFDSQAQHIHHTSKELSIHAQISSIMTSDNKNYDHLMQVYHVDEEEKKIFCEYIPHSFSKKYLGRNVTPGFEEIFNLIQQLCACLENLNYHKICHRDLKSDNLRVDEKGTIKIIDYGFATFNQQDMTGCFGSWSYISPEVASFWTNDSSSPYTDKCDIWSMGVILYEVIYQQRPFKSLKTINTKEYMEDLRNQVLNHAALGFKKTETINQQEFEYLQILLQGMLEKKPENRFGLIQIQGWINQCTLINQQQQQQKKCFNHDFSY